MTTCPTCQSAYDPALTGGPCPRCSLAGALAAVKAAGPTDYEFLHELGRGGMGVVSLVRQRSLDRLVALKVIAATDDAAAPARLLREARAAAAIQHPHVVAVHEVGQGDSGAFIAMEYCEGGDLRARLRQGPLTPRAAAMLGVKLAAAVAAAHAADVLHRDLKPSNVLLTAAGEPKLSDFGLSSSVASHSADLSRPGVVAGSTSYLAPELLVGAEPSAAVDIYGLGTILYECLAGRPPFTGDSPAAVLAQITTVEPVSPRRLNPAVPRDLNTIVLKCLEKNPAARYGSATALREDLERFLAGRPITARPVSLPGRLTRWARRNPALAAACALLILGTLATVALLAERNTRLRHALATTRAAEAQSRVALSDSLLAQARTIRQSGRQGQRHEAVRLAHEAAALGGDHAAARAEILAAAALEDWRWQQTSPAFPQLAAATRVDFSADLTTFALPDAAGNGVEIRRTADHALLRSLAPTDGASARVSVVSLGAQPGWVAAIHRGNLQAVWGPEDTRPRWTYQPDHVDYGMIRLADDGSGWWFTGPDHQLGWHDAVTGAERWLGSRGERLYGITPSPDGRALALVRDDRIEVWDLATDRARWTWRGDVGFAPAAWSADGRWLASDRHPGAPEIAIWDATTGEPAQVLRNNQRRSLALQFHPDGRRLLSLDGDSVLRIWDRWTGRELVRGSAGTHVLRIDADGTRVAVGHGIGSLGVLELAPHDIVRHFTPTAPFNALWRAASTSTDGRWVLGVTNAGLRLWDATTGREALRHEIGRDERAHGEFDPADGSIIYGGVRAGIFRLVPPGDGSDQLPAWRSITRLNTPPRTLVRHISNDAKNWLIEDYQREAGFVWAAGDPAQERPVTAANEYGMVMASPDGHLLVASNPTDIGAAILAWPDDQIVAKLPSTKPVWGYWSPDGQWCVLGANDGYTFWRTGEWLKPRFTLPADQIGALYGQAVFSPDSRHVALATGLHDFTIAATGDWRPQLHFTLPADAEINAWTWLRDNATLVVFAGPQEIYVFDLAAAATALVD